MEFCKKPKIGVQFFPLIKVLKSVKFDQNNDKYSRQLGSVVYLYYFENKLCNNAAIVFEIYIVEKTQNRSLQEQLLLKFFRIVL